MHAFLIQYRVMLRHATAASSVVLALASWLLLPAYLLCCCGCVCYSAQPPYFKYVLLLDLTSFHLAWLDFFLPSNPTAKDCVTMATKEHTVVTPKQPIHAEGSLE